MKKIIWTLFLLLLTFAISRYIFEPARLFYEFLWLDIPMHILGGYLVGALYISFFAYKEKKRAMLSFFIFVFTIMVMWEVHEYMRGQVLYNKISDYSDTLQDIIFGFLGAYLAYKKK